MEIRGRDDSPDLIPAVLSGPDAVCRCAHFFCRSQMGYQKQKNKYAGVCMLPHIDFPQGSE